MNFYTNVTPWGNTLLVREYVNGERINRKVKYSPTLFCKVIKETKHKTLDGQYYIADEYPSYVKWDIDKILVVTMDIEVACENGFPNPEQAIEPLLSITIKNHQNKQILVWGIGDYKNSREDVTYVKCDTEYKLVQEFLSF